MYQRNPDLLDVITSFRDYPKLKYFSNGWFLFIPKIKEVGGRDSEQQLSGWWTSNLPNTWKSIPMHIKRQIEK